jgi:hypothetical protein
MAEIRDTTYYGGMEDIKMVKELHANEGKERKMRRRKVGRIAVGVGREEIGLDWVVSDRKDTRHGFVDKPEPMSKSSEMLLEKMFGGWK